MRRAALALVALVVTAQLVGCAAQGKTTPRAQHNIVTAEELARTGDVSLYEALERIRPTFLRASGAVGVPNTPGLVVYLGGMRMEGVSHLRDIMAKTVREVKYLEPREANARFGGNNSGGALVVELL